MTRNLYQESVRQYCVTHAHSSSTTSARNGRCNGWSICTTAICSWRSSASLSYACTATTARFRRCIPNGLEALALSGSKPTEKKVPRPSCTKNYGKEMGYLQNSIAAHWNIYISFVSKGHLEEGFGKHTCRTTESSLRARGSSNGKSCAKIVL